MQEGGSGFDTGEGFQPETEQHVRSEGSEVTQTSTEASNGWLARMKENAAFHFYRAASALAGFTTGFETTYTATHDWRAGVGGGVGGAITGLGTSDLMIRIFRQAEEEDNEADMKEEESVDSDE